MASSRVEVLTHNYYGWTPSVELMEHMQLVHRLPSLQRFAVDNAQVYQPNWNLAVPGTSSMTELSITHLDIDDGWVKKMLSIPRALESFTLSVGGVVNTDGGMPMMSKAVVSQSLWRHRHTLKRLDIDLSIFTHDWDSHDEEDEGDDDWEVEQYGADYLRMDRELAATRAAQDGGDVSLPSSPVPPPDSVFGKIIGKPTGKTISSFREFRKLTHLSISVRTLVGARPPFRLADVLPSSLEYLCLYGYIRGQDHELDAHIADFVERKAELLPKLVEMRGVDKTVDDIELIFGSEPHEETMWQGIERDLTWKEAE